jgi:hypothetical protein
MDLNYNPHHMLKEKQKPKKTKEQIMKEVFIINNKAKKLKKRY